MTAARRTRPVTIVVAAGGTGGHLYPALAVADEIRRTHPDARIVFTGSRGKIESRVPPSRGYEFQPIWSGGFRRRLSAGTFLFPVKTVVAFLQSIVLLLRVKPDAVFGGGGYVSGPVVLAAAFLLIPTIIQEQNSIPGATTKMLSRVATEVHVTFEETMRHLPSRKNVFLTGNPTRAELETADRAEGAALFGFSPERTTLLVFGGSLGAHRINTAVRGALDGLAARSVQCIWQTGEKDADEIHAAVKGRNGVAVCSFIERMELAYAASDLVLCRAGATTLAELTRTGKPAILVPYPYAAADHQTHNARVLSDGGAAVIIPDRDLDERLAGVLFPLLDDPARREEMSRKAKTFGKPNAARTLAAALLKRIDGGGGRQDGT